MSNFDISKIQQFLPLLIPIIVLQFGLMVAALVDLMKRERTRGPKWVWILAIVFVNLFGSIAYFLFGRKE
jgi:drug/metabolite transporter (DMT)-like permease